MVDVSLHLCVLVNLLLFQRGDDLVDMNVPGNPYFMAIYRHSKIGLGLLFFELCNDGLVRCLTCSSLTLSRLIK